MALSVIGAGFGRTGTNSLKLALERIVPGRCYHMFEVGRQSERTAAWRAAGRGEEVDWEWIFDGYVAAVDWPAAYFWRTLAARYPGAKIVLTVRDPHAWWRSARDTIVAAMNAPPPDDPERAERIAMARELILERVFDGRFEDREHAIAVFEANTAAVMREIPPERRLVYEVAQGWEPLCRFLDRPIPGEPFPITNTTAEFRDRLVAPAAAR